MSIFTIKTENGGTGTPFIARLLFTILQLRDRICVTDDEKNQFDDTYMRFYDHAKLAYYSYKELLEIHKKYMAEVEAGTVVSTNNNTLRIDKVIDTDARKLTYSILSEAEIAFKELINEYPKMFDDFSLGFMAQDDKHFQKGLSDVKEKNAALGEYLESNRKKWANKLTEIRNKKEHGGWSLPEYHYTVVNGEIIVITPQIDGEGYLDYLQFVLASLFTFAEEVIVFTLSKNLRYEYVYEIPEDKRRTDITTRFDICLYGSQYKPWALQYKGPDMDLVL